MWRWHIIIPFTTNRVYPVESVTEMMLVAVITDAAEVVIGAFCTLPSVKSNRLIKES